MAHHYYRSEETLAAAKKRFANVLAKARRRAVQKSAFLSASTNRKVPITLPRVRFLEQREE